MYFSVFHSATRLVSEENDTPILNSLRPSAENGRAYSLLLIWSCILKTTAKFPLLITGLPSAPKTGRSVVIVAK